MNTAPFRTQSAPPTRAFGGGGGLSFAERAAAFRSTSEPTAATASLVTPVANARIVTTSTVAAPTEVAAPVAKPTFEKAPKLSAAAQAAYVPKNGKPADAKVIPTADMFPALPSKNTVAKTEAPAKSEAASKKPTFADIMKKRVAQDAIEAEIAERERLREQERKEREERDNRYYQIGTRYNSAAASTYEEEYVEQGYDGAYEENAFARPTGGYNPSDYGHHEEEDEMAPPVDDMGAPNDEEW
jgi:hypothetical protein